MKRLLETDRALDREVGAAELKDVQYAFYSAEAPGRGIEVRFSEYEAFALLNGLLLMKHGWPQSFAVKVLRRVRSELERHHERILAQDPKVLFDQEILRKAQPGDMLFDNTDPVLLTIVTKSSGMSNGQDETYSCAVCRGVGEAVNFARANGTPMNASTMFDVVNAAHRLSQELSRTKPRRRGRGR